MVSSIGSTFFDMLRAKQVAVTCIFLDHAVVATMIAGVYGLGVFAL